MGPGARRAHPSVSRLELGSSSTHPGRGFAHTRPARQCDALGALSAPRALSPPSPDRGLYKPLGSREEISLVRAAGGAGLARQHGISIPA